MCRPDISRRGGVVRATAVRLRMPLIVAIACLTGCVDDMADDARLKPLEKSRFFADGRSSREPVAGVVARGAPLGDAALRTGMRDGKPVDVIPLEVTPALLRRGRQRFEIHCVACHGRVGDGEGFVVRRGFPRPPSYHTERLRHAPAGHLFDVVTNGFGRMFGFDGEISLADRWAIVAYVQALQLSQHFPHARLSAQQRSELSSDITPHGSATASDEAD